MLADHRSSSVSHVCMNIYICACVCVCISPSIFDSKECGCSEEQNPKVCIQRMGGKW